MEYKKLNKDVFAIRIQRGESLQKSIKSFCLENKIKGGFFVGIGALDRVELALYDVFTKRYHSKVFEGAFELLSLLGNVGEYEGDIVIHAHASLGDKKMKTIGGHLVEGRVSGTAEIFFYKTGRLKKKYDELTGLKLFDFSS